MLEFCLGFGTGILFATAGCGILFLLTGPKINLFPPLG